MAFWYEGNRNIAGNERQCGDVIYYIRGLREVNGQRFERYAVKTHFIERGEDLIEVLRCYVLPVWRTGDIVTLGEKVVSMCQNNTVEKKDIKLGFWAKTLSKFATRNENGIGMDEPYKLQLAINMKGLPRVLWACFAGGICRLFGKRGVFYKIMGQDIAGIDGFYDRSSFEVYHTLAILNPENPNAVCAQVYQTLGMSCAVVDANDISVEILGKSPDIAEKSDDFLADLIGDNPSGQDDELTPFVLVRDIGDAEPEPYIPLVPADGPAH